MTAAAGRCGCGAVTVRAEGFAPKLWVCHCEICRRWQGFAGMGLDVPAAGFAAEGPIRLWQSSAVAERAFCGDCGGPVWMRDHAEGAPFEAMAGLFDDAAGAVLDHENFVDRRPEGVRFAGDHRRGDAADYDAPLPLADPAQGGDAEGRTRTGGCACGAVRFRVDEPGEDCGACHCGTCRRWTGGVFVGVTLRGSGLHLEQGAEHLLRWQSSASVERASCGLCGGKLWYRVTAPQGDRVGGEGGDMDICLGAFDDMAGRPLRREIFIEEKPAGYAFAAEAQRLTGAEARGR